MHALGLWSVEDVTDWILDTYGEFSSESSCKQAKEMLTTFFASYLKEEDEALSDFAKAGLDCCNVVRADTCL